MNHRKIFEWVGVLDTASSYEPEGRGFESDLVIYFFLRTFFMHHHHHAIVWILLKSSRRTRDIHEDTETMNSTELTYMTVIKRLTSEHEGTLTTDALTATTLTAEGNCSSHANLMYRCIDA